MSSRRSYPGVFLSRLQYRKSYGRNKYDSNWNVFAPPELIPLTERDVAKVVTILETESSDRREALMKSGLDLRTFKNAHFSAQMASTWIEAHTELGALRVNWEGMPPNEAREAAAMQSDAELERVFATASGGKVDLLRRNAEIIEQNVNLRTRLARVNKDDAQSLTSIDSEIGQRLGFQSCRLHDNLNEKLTPTRSARGSLARINQLTVLTGLATIPEPLKRALAGTLLDPSNPCFCTPYSYTWTEHFSRTWSYTLQLDYVCGVKWCHKKVWGVRVPYPCGLRWCTKSITFVFTVDLDIGFELRVECSGILVMVAGSACSEVTVDGKTIRSCIEAYALGGGGADVDVTIGTQAGECIYGLAIEVGLRATVGEYTIWEGSFGYGKTITMPCANQLNTQCTDTMITAQPQLIPGGMLQALKS